MKSRYEVITSSSARAAVRRETGIAAMMARLANEGMSEYAVDIIGTLRETVELLDERIRRLERLVDARKPKSPHRQNGAQASGKAPVGDVEAVLVQGEGTRINRSRRAALRNF